MSFDALTTVLLVRPGDAPALPDAEDGRLQDGHLAHLASLHEAGALVAGGPLVDQDDPSVRGIALLKVPAAEARALFDDDPRVRAGLLVVRVATWFVPAGAVSFGPAQFPRSTAEAVARFNA